MNIIVTLPAHTWELIRQHKSKLMLQAIKPVSFIPQHNIVYVCVKGTDQVYGYIEVGYIEDIYYPTDWYKYRGGQLGIAYPSFLQYCQSHRRNYAMRITRVVQFDPPISLKLGFYTSHAPQSFVYTDINIR